MTEEGDQVCFELDNLESVYSLSAVNKALGFLSLSGAEMSSAYGSIASFGTAHQTAKLFLDADVYHYGEPMLAEYASSTVGPAMFSKVDPGTGLCTNGVGPRFLIEESSSCYVKVDANNLNALKFENYARRFKSGRSTALAEIVYTQISGSTLGEPAYSAETQVLSNAVKSVRINGRCLGRIQRLRGWKS